MEQIIKRKSNGFYNTHEARKNSLKELILKYNIYNTRKNNECKKLSAVFSKYKDSIPNTIIELGYKTEDIMTSMPINYYEDETILKKKINQFINENGRFPLANEIDKKLKINLKFLYNTYGSIDNLKQILEYSDDKDLIDLRGDFNKSFIELFVANILVSNGLKEKYKREQYPFPKEKCQYRSDFTLYSDEYNKEIHIEVWGMKEVYKDNRMREFEYNRERNIKENLYKKYEDDIILIGINYEVFYSHSSYNEIQQEILALLNPYIKNLKTVDYQLLICTSKISDEQLLKEVLKYSLTDSMLPRYRALPYCIYNEILKRFGGYKEFSKKLNMPLVSKIITWDKELVFEYFKEIIEENHKIFAQTMRDKNKSFSVAISRMNETIIDLKIEFFYQYQGKIPNEEIEWLLDASSNYLGVGQSRYKRYSSDDAKILLDKFYNINELNKSQSNQAS